MAAESDVGAVGRRRQRWRAATASVARWAPACGLSRAGGRTWRPSATSGRAGGDASDGGRRLAWRAELVDPGGLAKFPRQIGEVPPAARRGPPGSLTRSPQQVGEVRLVAVRQSVCVRRWERTRRTGAFANDTAIFGSEAWHERIETATYGHEARRSGPRLAARRSESNRNHTNRATIWPQRNDTRPRLARSATIRATSGVCGCPVSLMGSVPALRVPRDGEHTKDRDRRSTTSVNGP